LKAWLAACLVLGVGAAVVAWSMGFVPVAHAVTIHPLAWDRADWINRPWTLWTSAWVHTSAGNLAGYLLALGALAVAGAALGAGRAAAAALMVAWPCATLALLLWPQVEGYAGLGGPIHAAAAVIAMHLAQRATFKPLSPLILTGLALKLATEHAWTQPVAFDPSWGINVVYAAHLTGALAGAAAAWVALRWPAVGRRAST
jgi:hypothetical protein